MTADDEAEAYGMRTKIALIVMLASFLVAAALAAGASGADAPPPAAATPVSPTPSPSTPAPATATSCPSGSAGAAPSEGQSATTQPGCPASSEEAAGEPEGEGETSPAPASSGVEQGTPIGSGTNAASGKDAGEGEEKSSAGEGGVVRNQTLGGSPNGSEDGGVSAPGHDGTKTEKAAKGKHGNGGSNAGAGDNATGPFGSLPIGVTDFALGSFEIPPLLLPVYQACGTQYGIPWEVLAAINKIETGFGANLGPSSAGAEGWMQFLPASWATYGVDADGDGHANPNDPVDAICAAARLLAAAGGRTDLAGAIFSYNHANWYVREVLTDAARYESVPANLVSALTGIAEDSQFPVGGEVTYNDDAGVAEMLQRNWLSEASASGQGGNAQPAARSIDIYARAGAPVVAVADGVIVKVGDSARLGRYLVLQDAYGSRFTYAQLGSIRARYRAPKLTNEGAGTSDAAEASPSEPEVEGEANSRRRLYALPDRPANRTRASLEGQAVSTPVATTKRRLRKGAHVTAGTVLAKVGGGNGAEAAHVAFSIQPDGSPKIDPKAILDGWRHGGAGTIYRAPHPLAANISPAEALLLSEHDLRRRALSDNRLALPACAQAAIRNGQVGREVLAGVEFLTVQGFKLGIDSSTCADHKGFSVSIRRVNGAAVAGHQGSDEPAGKLVQTVRRMQGGMGPQRVASASAAASESNDESTAVVSSEPSSQLIRLDFEPPRSARLVDGKAVAPINAPAPIQAMIAAANQISDTPYIWGGGHGSWAAPGYDCSGSVSYVLHAAGLLASPLTSGALERWGEPGAGHWVTVYANPQHTYAEIAGLRWDTVGDAQGSGPRWHLEPPYPDGFVVRHPAGF